MSEMQMRDARRQRRQAMLAQMMRERAGGTQEQAAARAQGILPGVMMGAPVMAAPKGYVPQPREEQPAPAAPQPFEGSGLAKPAPERPGVVMPIDEQRIREANQLLLDYKAAKTKKDMQIIRNQEWWRQHNWDMIREERGTNGSQPQKTATAWLKASIIAKHADYMAAYPGPIFAARNAEDDAEAKMLTEILPVILKRIHFEQTYSDAGWQMGVEGTGLYAVTWDGQADGGLGEICIRKGNVLNFYAEPGIDDVQDSSNVFYVREEDDRKLEAMYPQLRGKLGTKTFEPHRYREIEGRDNRSRSLVVDWYYKKWVGGRNVVHYCQYVGDTVLYATENDPQQQQTGIYMHGLYPFIVVPLHPDAGTIYGQGYVDVAYGTQIDIDMMSQAMVTNAVANATPRYFYRADAAVNREQFLDWSEPLVETNGNLGQDSLMRMDVPKMDGNTLSMYQSKVEELKFITGNTEVLNGDVPSGVTSGVAIAALKEDAGRSSRDSNRASYRAMEKLYLMCVELIRQFYTMDRQFRIVGEDGMAQYITYSNANLMMRTQQSLDGLMSYRIPQYDVEVHVQRENAYTRMAMNDLATQFYQMGVFNPMQATQALAMLKMMEFTGKEQIVQLVQQNFMQTMSHMGAGPTGLTQPIGGGGGAVSKSSPTEDDETESGKPRNAQAHTPATDRMAQRINDAVRP